MYAFPLEACFSSFQSISGCCYFGEVIDTHDSKVVQEYCDAMCDVHPKILLSVDLLDPHIGLQVSREDEVSKVESFSSESCQLTLLFIQ